MTLSETRANALQRTSFGSVTTVIDGFSFTWHEKADGMGIRYYQCWLNNVLTKEGGPDSRELAEKSLYIGSVGKRGIGFRSGDTNIEAWLYDTAMKLQSLNIIVTQWDESYTTRIVYDGTIYY